MGYANVALMGAQMDLTGRVAVVTGASSGCGKAIAAALEARGMRVAGVSRRSATFPCDVADPAAVEQVRPGCVLHVQLATGSSVGSWLPPAVVQGPNT